MLFNIKQQAMQTCDLQGKVKTEVSLWLTHFSA